MLCSRCGREAVVSQTYSGQHLCREHFIRDFEAKAKRAIRTHQWMRHDDHIAAAVFGDDKSAALLCFLRKIAAERWDLKISAIHIDGGTVGAGFLSRARSIADALGVDFFYESKGEEESSARDQLKTGNVKEGAGDYYMPVRHRVPASLGRKYGITRIAYGLSLDDWALSTLRDIACGEIEHLILSQRPCGEIPEIWPFMDIPGPEILAYARMHIPEFFGNDVPVPVESNDPLSEDIRTLLDNYTAKHPATRHALVNLGSAIADGASSSVVGISAYSYCDSDRGRMIRKSGPEDE